MIDNINKKWYVVTRRAEGLCDFIFITVNPNSTELKDRVINSCYTSIDIAEHIVEIHNKWLYKFI